MRLVGNYKKFVRNYGKIASSLTDLLKKDNFYWLTNATNALNQLKKSMYSVAVLVLPNFTQSFIVKTDTSSQNRGYVNANRTINGML